MGRYATAAALTLALLVGGLAWRYTAPGALFTSVDYSRGVISSLEELRLRVTRAESRQWAYFLTGNPAFLVERQAAIDAVQPGLDALLVQTLDNPAQQVLLKSLQRAIDRRLGLLAETLAMFNRGGSSITAAAVMASRAPADEVLLILRQAEQNESALLEERKVAERLRGLSVAALMAVLLGMLVVLGLRGRGAARKRLRDESSAADARTALLRVGTLQDAIFNSANFSSIATDASGVIQIFNVGAERMLGYKASEVVDKITPAGISDAQELIVRATALSAELHVSITPGFEALVFKASRGIEDIYELTYIRKDGSRFPAIVSVTALRDAQEQVIGYLLIGTDNTARKQVEAEQALLDQRLRDQQFYTRSLIESNIDALMTTDPRGIITDVNQQMAVLTGCTRDELIGAPFRSFFTDPGRAQDGIARVLSQGKVTNYELTAQARDGARTVVSYNATTFHDRERKLQGVFASARDITERKRFELTLQKSNLELEAATAAAEKANQAKSDFLSSMSHELRTPLNAILGFAQLIETGSPRPTPAQQESIVQILSSGWYLLELINEILDLALIESGRLTLSTEPVSLAEVILECQGMIAPQAGKRNIGMAFPHFETPCFVKADRTRIKQVLINLLFNAVKYNRAGGSVSVDHRKAGMNALRISVRDTGLGLAAAQLAQLFQPFNRLGKENSAEEGTGIGLVVTKRLIEMMGGTLGADSVVGEGSVFWFELPLSEAPQAISYDIDPTAPTPLPQRFGAPLHTVLYVEDNGANLKLMERLFARRADLRLLVATDGNAGVELARAHLPQAILMDINLPGLSGTEALQILRADPLTAHIPIIAVSANAVPGDIKRSLDAGFFSYVTKPIKLNELMGSLDAALQLAPPVRSVELHEPQPEPLPVA